MSSSTIESVLHENRVFPPSPEFVKQANISGMDAYRALVAEAEKDFDGFWGRLAKEELLWHPSPRSTRSANLPSARTIRTGRRAP